MSSELRSAGLLLYRRTPGIEVMLVHMGGPYWARKDEHAWSIPKGEYGPADEPLDVARREFTEETGLPVPAGTPIELGEITQRSGKRVLAWALEADIDVSEIRSNTFELEWPPRSGRMQSFPEADRAEWCDLALARTRIIEGQTELLDRLELLVS